jgi:hypothetical protein
MLEITILSYLFNIINIGFACHLQMALSENSGPSILIIWRFPKSWGYHQIIHFNRLFHYTPSIWGYHHFWKPLFWCMKMHENPSHIISEPESHRISIAIIYIRVYKVVHCSFHL